MDLTTSPETTAVLPPLQLGALRVDPPVVLAPMAGITDAPFRLVCAEQGGGLYVSEMVTAHGLHQGNVTSWAMVDFHAEEPVRSLQLYSSTPNVLAEVVAQLVAEDRVDHLDLNVGCPVPKVTRNGGGAALPVKRRLFEAVVRAAVDAAGPVPVTVKMRMGLDDDRHTFLDAGRIAADAGAAAVSLHARTVIQGYSGEADWDAIAQLREAVPDHVPVLGNGDIWVAEDALAMVQRTGCDGVVVGRGCLGRPWLFADLDAVFHGRTPAGPPVFADLVPIILRHLDLRAGWTDEIPEIAVMARFRKHLRWYLEGYPLPDGLHARAGQIRTPDDVHAILAEVDPDARVLPEAVRRPRGRTSVGSLKLPQGWWEDRDAMVEIAEPLTPVSGG